MDCIDHKKSLFATYIHRRLSNLLYWHNFPGTCFFQNCPVRLRCRSRLSCQRMLSSHQPVLYLECQHHFYKDQKPLYYVTYQTTDTASVTSTSFLESLPTCPPREREGDESRKGAWERACSYIRYLATQKKLENTRRIIGIFF